MTNYPESFVRQVVRNYSNDLKHKKDEDAQVSPPQQMLEDAFTKQVDVEDELTALILKAASRPEAAAALQEQFAALKSTVEDFNRAFPDVSAENGSSRSFSWKSLNKTILQLKEQHDAKPGRGFRGKTKKKFHGICATINDHISVLKVLPQGEYYTAPICGSVELIVKASINHELVGEEFGDALKEIDDIVVSVKRELTLSQDIALLGWTIELCCRIINFLAFPLRWYTQNHWKRAFASFNESLSDQYQGQVADIRRLSDLIRRGVSFRTAVQVNDLHDKLSDVADFVMEARKHHQKFFTWTEYLPALYHDAMDMHFRSLREHSEEHFKMMQHFVESALDNRIGAATKELMDWQARQWVTLSSLQIPNTDPPGLSALPDPSMASRRLLDDQSLNTKVEVHAVARPWLGYFEPTQIVLECPDANIFIEGRAAQRLQDWTAQASSSILGIFGPATSTYEDAARLLTVNYIRAARRAGIPCVSYFCNTTHEEPPAHRTRETVGLAQLAYALLNQLVAYLPARLPASPILSQDMFSGLDGTLKTWTAALDLLKSLVAAAAPPYMLFAIHGLELLEDGSTMSRLESFLDSLREIVSNEAGKGPKVKVLLTTSGLSQLLSEGLREDEICEISRGNSARRPGKSGKGRRRMGDLNFEEE